VLVGHGVVPYGRLCGVTAGNAVFAPDLPGSLAGADASVARFRARVDAFVVRDGLDVPAEEVRPVDPAPEWATGAARELDLRAAGVRTVVWATGYRRDYGFIDAPVLDADGEPVQHRGVSPAPGLYFLGLFWMHRRGSNSIDGVDPDAAYLADVISEMISGRPACTAA
jgi:putative flavoprotein involved in K+ transport